MSKHSTGSHPSKEIEEGAYTPVRELDATKMSHPEFFSPLPNPPLKVVEFSTQTMPLTPGFSDHEVGSVGGCDRPSQLDPSNQGGSFRLVPRKPHLIDRSPARGRKRSAQSMCSNTSFLRETPPSPMTNNMIHLQSLSLHSPVARGKPPPSPQGTTYDDTTWASPATCFSKVEGSPFQKPRSDSIDRSCDRSFLHRSSPDAPSPKFVPLTVLTHTCKKIPFDFLSPPRSSSSLPNASPRGSVLTTPVSMKESNEEVCFSTPGSAKEVSLPKISLTPRSAQSRRSRGAIPRFPSPTESRNRQPAEKEQSFPPPHPLTLAAPSLTSRTKTEDSSEKRLVSTESTPVPLDPSSASRNIKHELIGPPVIGRSLLGPASCPLDSFLLHQSEGLNEDTESLSDDDTDGFFLAFPSTIIEEKQRQRSPRHAKQPRTNITTGDQLDVSMTSFGSLSSLRGMAFALSDHNIREASSTSIASLNNCGADATMDLKRAESSASIGMTLDKAFGSEYCPNRRDLVTPPVECFDIMMQGPPMLNDKKSKQAAEEASSFVSSSRRPKQNTSPSH